MQTTEVFVEQLLTGLLVVAVIAGLLVSDPTTLLTGNEWLDATLVFGVAYLLGLVCDRFADTILEELEQHHRLLFGLRCWRRKRSEPNRFPPIEDPFPENELRKAILSCDNAVAHANYLRTRMRLIRSLTVLTPALVVVAMVHVARLSDDEWLRRMMGVALTLAYGLAFFAGNRDEKTAVPKTWKIVADPHSQTEVEGKEAFSKYAARVNLNLESGLKMSSEFWLTFMDRKLGFIALTLLILAAVLIAHKDHPEQVVLAIVGAFATVLFAWAWWRISETYYAFLMEFKPVSKVEHHR